MYTLILTAIGLLLLAAFVVPSRQRARACSYFIGTWLVLCACHVAWRLLGAGGAAGIAGLAGVAEGGQDLMQELGDHVMVFGFPALLAQALRKRFSTV